MRLGARRAFIIGDYPSVSQRAEIELTQMLGQTNVIRLGGTDRHDTACTIYEQNASSFSDTAILTIGSRFADALSIGPYSYAAHSPIFLVQGDTTLDQRTINTIQASNITKIVILGDQTSVSEQVKTQLGSSYTYQRLSGPDRYNTCADIVNWLLGTRYGSTFESTVNFNYSNVTLTTGQAFPDALCASTLCGTTRSVLLLTEDGDNPELILHILLRNRADEINRGYILGYYPSVSLRIEGLIEGYIIEGL